MEEAEFLSDRIGLINDGQLRAIGTSSYLKSQFCNWIIVELVINHSIDELVARFISEIGGEVIYSILEFVKIKVTSDSGIYQRILVFIEKQAIGQLKTWSIKKGTLEDVFSAIQEKYGAEKEESN